MFCNFRYENGGKCQKSKKQFYFAYTLYGQQISFLYTWISFFFQAVFHGWRRPFAVSAWHNGPVSEARSIKKCFFFSQVLNLMWKNLHRALILTPFNKLYWMNLHLYTVGPFKSPWLLKALYITCLIRSSNSSHINSVWGCVSCPTIVFGCSVQVSTYFWSECVRYSLHPSITYHWVSCTLFWGLSQLTLGESSGAPWTSCQLIAGLATLSYFFDFLLCWATWVLQKYWKFLFFCLSVLDVLGGMKIKHE